MFLQLVMLALAASSWARSTPSSQNLFQDEETSSDLRGGLSYLFKVYSECSSSDMATCLKLKFVSMMDRADRSFPEVPLVNGFVSLVKSDNVSSSVVYKSENEIEAALPRSFGDKNTVLNSIIVQKISDFLNSHTIKIKLPSIVEMQRSLIEGRKKKDKEHSHMSIYYTILLGILLPIAIGTLAIFAGKAVLASTIALVLSGIIGLKNLFQTPTPSYNRSHYGLERERHDYHRYHDNDAYNDYSRHYSERDESQGNLQDIAYNAYQSKP